MLTSSIKFQGTSMRPLIQDGEEVSIAFFEDPKKISDFSSGDIVLTNQENEWVLHRVVCIKNKLFLKGDLNKSLDSLQDLPVWGELEAIESSLGRLFWPASNSIHKKVMARISPYYLQSHQRLLRGGAKLMLIVLGSLPRVVKSMSRK